MWAAPNVGARPLGDACGTPKLGGPLPSLLAVCG